MERSAEAAAARLSPDRLGNMTDYERIVFYELVGLRHARESADRRQLAHCLSNAGLAYANEHRFQEAITYVQEAEAIFDELKDVAGLAATALNVGVAYAEGRQVDAAQRHFTRAFDAAIACGDAKVAR